MEFSYLLIICFLLALAVFDLWVGVSNDAVNFLNSAVGSKVATFRTVLVIASLGVFLGAVTSNGMMDVARHGIMVPSNFTFDQVIVIFLAVMVTDVIILDIFNNLGLPTSTTVSMVFELIGGTFALACIKMLADSGLEFTQMLNAGSALKMIAAIFFSVLVAFVLGTGVQWLSRLAFTFKYKERMKYFIGIFGGFSITVMLFFVFYQGLKTASFVSDADRAWVNGHFLPLTLAVFVVSVILSQVLHMLKVNVLKIVVLFGTFSLALAFAGNDLVNFIGVPLAGLSSYQDYAANGGGDAGSFMMTSLESSATSPLLYLVIAAMVMVFAMITSKKARNVIKTSVDLSAQDEGDEMFGTSRAARSIVRASQSMIDRFGRFVPQSWQRTLARRFNTEDISLPKGAAFDEVRASVNLVISAMLIILGTTQKLPLSTTYVTFMVAMGSSLADKAWGRENAVFRITGVLSVVGGWLLTAAIAFTVCAVVTACMFYGGFFVQCLFMVAVVLILWRSNRIYNKKQKNKAEDETFQLLVRTKSEDIAWELLKKHVVRTQADADRFVMEAFSDIRDGFVGRSSSTLRGVKNRIEVEQKNLERLRRREIIGLRHINRDVALERNTWYHLSINSAVQYIYCLKRMLEPVKNHVDNNFNALPKEYAEEFGEVFEKTRVLMSKVRNHIATGDYSGYRNVMTDADDLKDELSVLRKRHIDRIQLSKSNRHYQVAIVYLNLIQECQMLLSIMRHQLRATKKFTDDTESISPGD
ncbi:MAG: inorganic phosphate transporter [Prevotella sp.]|uniref:inorganic phosphate transporter n=1 Tax=Prevotella sp. TaxID=59823 RepID=UPI002A29E775|nr:inorganic phosphate transporter [Prevotella sp.]MDD7317827.1 inorganic phosphate transporter [Prevotellaceae bacterium]MDY4020742.1 inorganic phosphate transporter [Prevotella sp.]